MDAVSAPGFHSSRSLQRPAIQCLHPFSFCPFPDAPDAWLQQPLRFGPAIACPRHPPPARLAVAARPRLLPP
eukprot:2176077-Rhodomonas_salina.1